MRELAKDYVRVCITHRHIQQYGDGLKEGGMGTAWWAKGEKRETSVSVDRKNKVKKKTK